MPMRLGTRLVVSYVAAMAVVLVGFSVALYALADKHLHRQVDERLEGAVHTLVAAAEVGPEGVEWEPQERNLTFGRRTLEGQFAWRVGDLDGTRVDGSATGEIDRLLARLGTRVAPARGVASIVDEAGNHWRAMSRHLTRPVSSDEETRNARPLPGRHAALVLGAATSLEGVRATLRNLALALGGLSLAIWTLALVTGWQLCRMALRPLSEMAEAAHAIGGDEPGRRLPAPVTDDELGELGRSFNGLLDRLGESLERQQRFTGDASHQLRTPLTALQGHVDLALRQDRSPEEYRRVLGLVQSKTRHVRQIVEGLLFLSRADAESRRPALEEVALDSWIRDHLDAWPDPRRADVLYEPELTGVESCRALAHAPLLGELFGNLLDNAAKYSPRATPIRVRLSRRDGEIFLSVTDQGPGIDRVDLPRLFDPFFRTEAARTRGSQGVGLGLSVAARIAAVFGGRITVESTPGLGATFTIHLPAYDESDAPAPAPSAI